MQKHVNIQVIRGDITKIKVDAIVNAANAGLRGGGGVDGAIHHAGGPSILRECREIIARIGKLETGRSVITGAGQLPARHVIHTVGPIYNPAKPVEMKAALGSCYQTALEIAEEYALSSVAFPNISTGIYGYPKEEAAEVAIAAVHDSLENLSSVDKILYVCFDSENFVIYRNLLS